MNILVTGAAGFVGRALCASLAAAGHSVHAAVRNTAGAPAETASVRPVGDLATFDAWAPLLHGIDAVVHLAARVHVMRDTAADPQAAFDAVNATATERLARACARAGVRRFVFFSSVKVNGEATGQRAFTETDPPAPADPYGRSKLAAERAIARVAGDGGLEPVVLRPPLVYGPGVGGNVMRLMRLIEHGVPLPLGAVRNRRSMVSVWNLTDAALACVANPRAAGRTFLVSDGDDLSTPRMITELARGMDRRPRLLPVPPRLLRAAAALLGRQAEIDRLCGSLQVDASAIRHTLAWTPPVTADEGLRRTGRAWRERARGQTW
jgi:nucleoside-diphosphate-sugar epimerase